MSDNSVIFFDDLVEGSKTETMGRTITEADTVLFANFANEHRPVYSDAEYCKTYSPLKERLIDPMLLQVILSSLFANSDFNAKTGLSTLAFLGINDWKVIKDAKIGDTIHTVSEIFKLRDNKPDRGIVTHKTTIVNQNDEVLQEGYQAVYMAKRNFFDKK